MKSIKKLTGVALSLLILISVFAVAPITANAEVSKSGTVGDCQYEFDSTTGHLRIFGGTTIEKDGNGKMPWATDGPLTFNSSSVKSVTIEDGIKTIGNGAFYWCKNLTSVTMPNNLTYIGKSAFSDCTGLKTINLPFYLETIDMAAFSNCTALESISISTHIQLIGNEAFKGCTKLAEVTINDGAAAEIGDYAFCDTALTDVFIPAGTKKIGACAFGYDKGYSPVAAFTIYTTEGSVGDNYVKNNIIHKDIFTVEYIKPITNVDFTNIVEPVVGESPSFTYNTTSEGFTVKNAKPVWNNETDYETVSATKKFKNLKEYSVAFTLKANKGYRFAVNAEGKRRNTTVKGTINGQEAIISGDSITPEDEITVGLTFPKLMDPDNPVLIYDVNIRLDEQPKAGDHCESKLRTYGEGYSVDSLYWYNVTDAKRVYSGNVFEPLKEYKLNVFLKADEYYEFCYADNAIQVGGEIDGKAINTYEAYKKDPHKYICVESTSYIMGEQDISTVAFTKINEPIVDRPAIFTYQASAGFTVENDKILWWNDTDKKELVNGDKFEKGKTYIAFFSITAKDGYNFTDDNGFTTVTATVNHKEAIVQQLPGQNPVKQLRVYVKYFYIQEKTPLPNVEITDLDKPVAGEKPDYNVSVSSNATVTDIIWREEGRKMKSGDVYQYSRQYTVYIYIEPDSGYTFRGDSRNATINGSEAQVSFDYYEDYIIALADFVTEHDPEATTDPNASTCASEPTESSPEETTEPDTGKTTDPEETTEPLETTEPKETSETEETTSVITEPDVITISYLPSDEQELNGYNYWLFFKDKDGNSESIQMIPTGDKANGKDIYGAVLPADKEYIEMYIQIFYGEEWVKQIEINPDVAKNAIIGSDGNPITVEPDTDPETPSDPEIPTDPDTPTTPSGKYQTLSYMPDKNILDKSDKIVIVVQDAEGNVETTEMIKTSETSGGVPIYTAQIPADKELYMATFKYYNGETFVGQLNVSGTQLKAAEGKIIDSFGNIVTPDTPKVTAKKANPIKVTAKTKSVKLKKLKKKTQKVKSLTIKKAQGKVSIKITKAKKNIKKFLKINTKGTLTIKKWKKAKKGTYKIKVQIKAKGNTNYKSKTINKIVKVKVK